MFKKISAIVAVVLISLLSILLVTLKVAPAIGIYFSSKWYAKQGENYRLEVQDWQFSPFDTQLTLNQVVLHHPDQGEGKTVLVGLSLAFNPWELLDRQLLVQSIVLSGLSLDLALTNKQDKVLSIAGLSLPLSGNTVPTDSEPSEPWGYQLQRIELKDIRFNWHVSDQEFITQGQLQLKQLQLQDISSQNNHIGQVKLSMQLDDFALNSPELKLTEPLSLTAKGKLNELTTNPTWQGDLALDNVAIAMQDKQLNIQEIILDKIVASAQKQTFKQLLINDIQAQAPEAQLHLSSVRLDTALNQDQHSELAQVDIKEVQLEALGLTQTLAALTLANIARDEQQIKINEINLEQFALAQDQTQFALKQFYVQGINLNSTAQKISLIQLHELAINTPEPWLSLQRYESSNIDIAQLEKDIQFNLGQHNFAGFSIQIKRNKNEQLEGLPEITVQTVTTDKIEPEPSSNAEPIKTLVLDLSGLMQQINEAEHNSRIVVVDNSVSPKLDTLITVNKFEIGEAKPVILPNGLSMTQGMPMQLALTMGSFGTVQTEALLGIYHGKKYYPEGSIKLNARQLDMVDFNGYLIKAIGYQVERGSLDVDANIRIHKAEISGEVKLMLRNSKFTPADEKIIKKVSKQLAMPVDMALDLLRDKNGNVVLTIPLSGSLDDPDFGVRDVLRQLTNKALKTTALYLIKQSIQPYGTLLSVASYAGDYLFAIRLDALHYSPQQSDISSEQQKHLSKIAQLMTEKKSIEVQGCPFVDKAEAESLGDGWPELAKARGTAVKQWFEANYPEQSARFTLCRPQQGERAEMVLGVN